MKPAVIVGAGVSGLASGVALSLRGIPVVLLERAPRAGGRAYSFTDRKSGEETDNGQHVLIAGYARTLRLLDTLGSRHLLRVQPRPRLVFHHPAKKFRSFSVPQYLSPFHLLAAILGSDLFSWSDRIRLLRAGIGLAGEVPPESDCPIDDWLARHGQSTELRRSFWDPLAVAIMNEHTSRASARVFVHALRVAFLGGWENARVVIPSVGLSSLLVAPAIDFIRLRGGEIRYSAEAVGVRATGGAATAVLLRDASEVECSGVIETVPPVGSAESSSPIISIHLWFERDFMREEMVGAIGRTVQWVFNKRISGGARKSGGHVSAVISAAGALVDRSNEELTSMALADLRGMYGGAVGKVLRSLVIRERRATMSLTPDAERRRPGHVTARSNVFLAGDWTATGLPATIEGAVISGETAAAALYQHCYS